MAIIERRRVAWVLIALGILLNPWLLGWVLAADGTLEDGLYVLNIFFLDCGLILSGLLLMRRANLLRYLVGGAISAFLLLSVHNGYRLVAGRSVVSVESRDDADTPRSDNELLREAVSLTRRNFTALDLESSELMHELHRPIESFKVQVPAEGVLDTAVGVHPWILDLFRGKVRFEIHLRQNDTEWQRVYRKTYDLSEADISQWQAVTVDLAEHAGQEIELKFVKWHEAKGAAVPRQVFDLAPADFMFFRKPRIRPLSLTGQKNVILISLDTLRVDHLKFMGYRRETSPTLDRLAQNGAYFTQCISQAPWTTPSHFSILTGTYPSVHGGNRPHHETKRWWNDQLPTMASMLSHHGYTTGAFTGRGSISAEFGFFKGFDFYNESGRDDQASDIEAVIGKTIDWLQDNKSRTFFLFVHTYEAHGMFADNYFVDEEGIRDDDVFGLKVARYDGDIRRTDHYVGKLMDSLEQLDLTQETLVIITSDHGEELYEVEPTRSPSVNPIRGPEAFDHGHSLYDDQLRVPLIVYGPGFGIEPRRIESQVRSIDILPTAMDYLGLSSEGDIQGESLRSFIAGDRAEDLPAFSEATSYGSGRQSIRTGDFKLIRRVSYGQLTDASSAEFPLTPPYELYDLVDDPGETKNLAASAPDKVRELEALLQQLLPANISSNTGAPDDLALDLQESPEFLEELRSLGYID